MNIGELNDYHDIDPDGPSVDDLINHHNKRAGMIKGKWQQTSVDELQRMVLPSYCLDDRMGTVPQVMVSHGDEHFSVRYDGMVHKWCNNEWKPVTMTTPLPSIPDKLYEFDVMKMLRDIGREDIIEAINKENGMEVINMEKNLFKAGQVIDIRVGGSNGLPNRVQIVGMQYDINGNDGWWKYKCQMEDTGEVHEYDERFLQTVMIKMDSPVYLKPVIKERYKNGWRFVGNWSFSHCKKFGESLAKDDRIAHVRVCEAYNANGDMITDGTSLWIQYNRPIPGGITNQKTVKLDIK